MPARHCETMSPFVGVHGDIAKSYLDYFKLVLSRSRNPCDLKKRGNESAHFMIILKLTVTKDLTRLEGPNDCCYAPKTYSLILNFASAACYRKKRHVLLEHPNKPFL